MAGLEVEHYPRGKARFYRRRLIVAKEAVYIRVGREHDREIAVKMSTTGYAAGEGDAVYGTDITTAGRYTVIQADTLTTIWENTTRVPRPIGTYTEDIFIAADVPFKLWTDVEIWVR